MCHVNKRGVSVSAMISSKLYQGKKGKKKRKVNGGADEGHGAWRPRALVVHIILKYSELHFYFLVPAGHRELREVRCIKGANPAGGNV